MKKIFKTTATTTGGRNGKIKSEDKVLDLEVRVPKEMGGPGGAYTNPEQLFAAGYSACFDSALNYTALTQKIKIESEVSVTVGLLKAEDGGFDLCVSIEAKIDGVERDKAQELLDLAHKTCPYSKAIRNNVEVQVKLK